MSGAWPMDDFYRDARLRRAAALIEWLERTAPLAEAATDSLLRGGPGPTVAVDWRIPFVVHDPGGPSPNPELRHPSLDRERYAAAAARVTIADLPRHKPRTNACIPRDPMRR